MKTLTLHNIPDALHAAIEAQARLHQRSVEEEMRHMLELATRRETEAAATVQPPLEEQAEGSKRNTLADLFDAIPAEYRLTKEESEFLNNLRYNTSANPRWPE